MKELILGIWLGVQGYLDFKYKEIPLWLSILGAIGGIGFGIVEKRAGWEVFMACIPGVLALLFSWMSKEVMGYGDGIVLLVMGSYLPLSKVLSIGMMAFFLAGVIALVLLVVFRKKGSYRMAFVPFLSVAYILDGLLNLGGT